MDTTDTTDLVLRVVVAEAVAAERLAHSRADERKREVERLDTNVVEILHHVGLPVVLEVANVVVILVVGKEAADGDHEKVEQDRHERRDDKLREKVERLGSEGALDGEHVDEVEGHPLEVLEKVLVRNRELGTTDGGVVVFEEDNGLHRDEDGGHLLSKVQDEVLVLFVDPGQPVRAEPGDDSDEQHGTADRERRDDGRGLPGALDAVGVAAVVEIVVVLQAQAAERPLRPRLARVSARPIAAEAEDRLRACVDGAAVPGESIVPIGEVGGTVGRRRDGGAVEGVVGR